MKSAQTADKAPKAQSVSKKSPTAAEALALVNSLRGEAAKYGYHDTWIHHAILVGDCAGKIAAAIREHQLTVSKPQLIDPDRTAHRLQAIYTLKAKIERHLPSRTVEDVLGLPPSNPKLGTIPKYPSR